MKEIKLKLVKFCAIFHMLNFKVTVAEEIKLLENFANNFAESHGLSNIVYHASKESKAILLRKTFK